MTRPGLLEKASHVAFIAACVILSAVAFVRLSDVGSANPSTKSSRGAMERVFEPGTTVPTPSGVDYSSADLTVLIAVHSTCSFCTESMPFYRDLAEKAARSQGRVRLAVASYEDDASLGAYLARHDLQVDIRARLTNRPSDRRIEATPTMIVIDRAGAVRASWKGRLSPTQEEDSLRAMEIVRP